MDLDLGSLGCWLGLLVRGELNSFIRVAVFEEISLNALDENIFKAVGVVQYIDGTATDLVSELVSVLTVGKKLVSVLTVGKNDVDVSAVTVDVFSSHGNSKHEIS